VKKANKKVVRSRNLLPIAVLVLGFLLGGSMIGFGIYKNLNSSYDELNIRNEEQVKDDIASKMVEIEQLKEKREEEFNTSAISEEYENITREISIKEGELLDFEAELVNIQNGFYNNLKEDKIWGSVPLIVFGVMVIIFGIGLFMKLNSSTRKNVILTVSEEK
jgi:hypothetical protein